GLNKSLTKGSENLTNIESKLTSINSLSPGFINNFQNINTEAASLQKNLGGISIDITQVNRAFNAGHKSANNASKAYNTLAGQIGQASRRFTVFLATATFVRNFSIATQTAADEALKFQDALVKIGQITQRPTSSLKGLSGEISNIASDLGVSSQS